jgi:hypothetical protein
MGQGDRQGRYAVAVVVSGAATLTRRSFPCLVPIAEARPKRKAT